MAKVSLTNVRLAFPALFEAKTVNGEGDPAYSGNFIIDGEDDANLEKMNEAIEAAAKEKWGAKAEGILKTARSKDKVCLHDGDDKAQYDGFPGNFYVSARNKARPIVLDRDKTPLTAQDGRVYAGCYVNVSLEVWAQDNSYGKRVNAELKGVQFARDGDSFGGGSPGSADDFDDISEGADAEALA